MSASENSDPFADLRFEIAQRAWQRFYKPRAAPVRFPQGQQTKLYDMAARAFGLEPITYLEFGVFRGWSLSQISQRFPHREARFFGFDSFEGLPETWATEMGAGHFSTNGAFPNLADSRIQYVKGWFQNTLPEFLKSNPISGKVLVHFDADLYSSTLFLLSTLWHYVPKYYFFFDEFVPDEVTAMCDFAQAYPIEFEFLACTQDELERPRQVFGRLARTPLHLK